MDRRVPASRQTGTAFERRLHLPYSTTRKHDSRKVRFQTTCFCGYFFQDWAEDFQISSTLLHLSFSPWNTGITVSCISLPQLLQLQVQWLITGLFAQHFVNLPGILIRLYENERQPRTNLRKFSKHCNPVECHVLNMNMKGVLRLIRYLIYT